MWFDISLFVQIAVMGDRFPFDRVLGRMLAWLPLRVDEAEVVQLNKIILPMVSAGHVSSSRRGLWR